MTTKPNKISDAELQLLQLLWDESPLGATEIFERVPADRDWTLATVKTFLSRLVTKGAVTAEPQGRRFLYSPAIQREPVAARQADRLVDRLFGGRAAPLFAQLAEAEALSDDDIAEIERLLKELRK